MHPSGRNRVRGTASKEEEDGIPLLSPPPVTQRAEETRAWKESVSVQDKEQSLSTGTTSSRHPHHQRDSFFGVDSESSLKPRAHQLVPSVATPSPEEDHQVAELQRYCQNLEDKCNGLELELTDLKQWNKAYVDSRQAELKALINSTTAVLNTANQSQHIAAAGSCNGSLKPNTFSFLVVSKNKWSIPFATGIIVFFFKNAIFGLLLANLLDRSEDDNVFGIPGAVSGVVLMSQLFAFLISVMTQDDLVTSQIMYFEGCPYEDDGTAEYKERKRRWILAIVLLFVDGSFGVVVTFLLIVTSETVLDVVLNFAAIEFVTKLDEAAFFLASVGFFGVENRACAVFVKGTAKGSALESSWKQIVFQMLLLLAVLGLWLYVISKQSEGDYVPKHLLVQFDDELRSDLTPHSGFYAFRRPTKFYFSDDKFRYVEVRYNDGVSSESSANERGEFGYCRKERRWVFRVAGSDPDPCNEEESIKMKSSETFSYNLASTASDPWFVLDNDRSSQDGSSYSVPMGGFYLAPGCKDDDDCGGTERGSCREDKCSCMDGFRGFFCSFRVEEVCRTLVVDERFSRFPAHRIIASTFDRHGSATFYGRPVYVNHGTWDVLLFTGLRWALINLNRDGLLTTNRTASNQTIEGIADAFGFGESTEDDHIQASKVIQKIDFLSSPVPVRSALDQSITPVGLAWHSVIDRANFANAKLSPNTPTIALICIFCNDDTNKCLFNNHCNSNSTCSCADREKGPLCQIAPSGDGRCDPAFNAAEFNFDGGDCCPATCVSSPTGTCGAFRGANMRSEIDVGFPMCRDSNILPDECFGDDPCYVIEDVLHGALSETNVIPKLSANGRILVLSEPDAGLLQVFERVGNHWTPLGGPVVDHSSPHYGRIYGLSVDVWTSLGPLFLPKSYKGLTLFVAVGTWCIDRWSGTEGCCIDGTHNYEILVYKLLPFSTLWEPVGTEICLYTGFGNNRLLLHVRAWDIPGEPQVVKVFASTYAAFDGGVTRIFRYDSSGSSWSTVELDKLDAMSVSGHGQTMVGVRGSSLFIWLQNDDKPLSGSAKRILSLKSNVSTVHQPSAAIENIQLSFDGTMMSLSRVTCGNALVERYKLHFSEENEVHGVLDSFVNTSVKCSGYTETVFSPSGDSFLVVNHEDLQDRLTINIFGNPEGVNRVWRHNGQLDLNDAWNVGPPYYNLPSISDGGMNLAFFSGSSVQVAGLQNNWCGVGSFALQVSIALPAFQQYISDPFASWKIRYGRRVYEEYFSVPVTSIRESMLSIVNVDTTIFERLCVPERYAGCLQIQFRGGSHREDFVQFEFATFGRGRGQVGEGALDGDPSMSEIWSGSSISQYPFVVVRHPLEQTCEISVMNCTTGKVPFILIFVDAAMESEISWSLLSNNSTVLPREVRSDGNAHQVCLSSNASHSLTVDNLGSKEMLAFFGGQLIAQKMGDFSAWILTGVDGSDSFADTDSLSTFSISVDFGLIHEASCHSLYWEISDVLSGRVRAAKEYLAPYSYVYRDGNPRRRGTNSIALASWGCYSLFLDWDHVSCQHSAVWEGRKVPERNHSDNNHSQSSMSHVLFGNCSDDHQRRKRCYPHYSEATCADGFSPFNLQLDFDRDPPMWMWKIRSSNNGSVRVGYYDESCRQVEEALCLSVAVCHTFTFRSSDSIEGHGTVVASFGGQEVVFHAIGWWETSLRRVDTGNIPSFGEGPDVSTIVVTMEVDPQIDRNQSVESYWIVEDTMSAEIYAEGLFESDYNAPKRTESMCLTKKRCYNLTIEYYFRGDCLSGSMRYMILWEQEELVQDVVSCDGDRSKLFGNCTEMEVV